MIRALIVDDHAVVRNGIVHIIAETNDIKCVAEANQGSEALQLVRENDYDIVVLDIRLPDISGLDILKQLLILKPRLRVLILSGFSEKQYATRALKAGALGYLTKDSIPEELIAAIHKVAHGERYVSLALGEILASRLSGKKEPHDSLSDREYQVMCMLASGKAVTQVAKAMGLSVKTVSTYRSRLLDKLRLESTAELIHYAIQNDLCQ